MQMPLIRVRASNEMVEKIDEVARQRSAKTMQRVTRAAIIREACREYLENRQSRATCCTAPALSP